MSNDRISGDWKLHIKFKWTEKWWKVHKHPYIYIKELVYKGYWSRLNSRLQQIQRLKKVYTKVHASRLSLEKAKAKFLLKEKAKAASGLESSVLQLSRALKESHDSEGPPAKMPRRSPRLNKTKVPLVSLLELLPTPRLHSGPHIYMSDLEVTIGVYIESMMCAGLKTMILFLADIVPWSGPINTPPSPTN